VSRQPVREAIIKLADAGLVEVRPQRGTYVLLISEREVKTAVSCARRSRSPSRARLAKRSDRRKHPICAPALPGRKWPKTAASTRSSCGSTNSFTRRSPAADCESAWKVLEGLKAQMDRVRFLSIPMATPVPTLIAQHDEIAEAIIAGDPDRAEDSIRVHLREILKSLPKLSAEHPDLFVE
jgi:DNA-binding GntR family transcriptional regulator